MIVCYPEDVKESNLMGPCWRCSLVWLEKVGTVMWGC